MSSAGPIVRAREFIPQPQGRATPRDVAVGSGVVLIALGPGKKVPSPNYLASPSSIPVFGVPRPTRRYIRARRLLRTAAQDLCDSRATRTSAHRHGAADGLRVPAETQQPLPRDESATSGGAGT